ncbi:MAG: helix-turn-helix transcriptional regulator [Oceanicoccus sp.]|uniref:helix-turn-helix transcriptional regulator n=1 Tax=Oceanicoccus sp. TaxID=2691044 RepID=UPI002624A3CB|nr:helix-turn-helix transcriptional regulator [Oceanicoccus sp.]MCP3908150.1 helix-turn-helix transcriptional regulator [Oceanicoccus sp.]MDG1772640.1 helix-turn-helix transcriptional regulator [Oceanicoccus sp.]
MEQMIDKDLIKKLRIERSWSQDQLSSVSGLSLRTIQRIENEGTCSLESKKALAAAFEINANKLDINTAAINTLAANNRGRKFGFAGTAAGLVSAYIGITMSYTSGNITSSEAGLYYGSIGAFCGICCAIIGICSNRYIAKVKT